MHRDNRARHDCLMSPSVFASHRERRLWAWTLGAVVAIYSTLGLTGTLAEELRNRDLLAGTFVLGMGTIGAAIVILALKQRPGGAEIGVAMSVIAVYVMVLQRMASVVERSHLFEYSAVAVLIHEALRERAVHGRPVRRPAGVAIVATTLIGTVDECIQLFLPSRVFDPIDIGFNSLAAVMAVAALLALERARQTSLRRRGRSVAETMKIME